MSFGISDPVTGELAANKANRDGSDITNPDNWRDALELDTVVPAATAAALARRAFAGGVEFDGEIGYAVAPISATLGDVAISAYIKADSSQRTTFVGVFRICGEVVNESGINVNFSSGDLRVGYCDNSTIYYYTGDDAEGGLTLSDFSQFRHLLVQRSGDNLEVYLDGELLTTNALSSPPTTMIFSNFVVGRRKYSSESFRGLLKHAKVFNRALSASEVAELYESGHVAVADRWGSVVPDYASDFRGGNNGWSGVHTGTVLATGTVGGEADALTVANPSSIRTAARIPTPVVTGKRYRLTGRYYVPSQNTSLTGFFLTDNVTAAPVQNVVAFYDGTNATDAWHPFEFEFTYSAESSDGIRLQGSNVSGTGIITPGDEFSVKDVVFQPLGCIASLPLDEGVGRQLRDVSMNGYHALASETGVAHLLPDSDGSIDVSDVDASSRVALLEDSDILPENAVIYAASVRINDEWYSVNPHSTAQQVRTKRSIEVSATGVPESLRFYRGDDSSHFASVMTGTTTIDQITLHYRKAS